MSKRILLIEDDLSLGQTFVELMELLGFKPVLSDGYQSALDVLAEDHNWSAIISDFSLGDGLGSDIMRHCLSVDALKNTSLIITSGYERESKASELSGLDKVQWLMKPYKIDELIQLLS